MSSIRTFIYPAPTVTVNTAGLATSANQATEIASLASIDSKLTGPLSITGPLTDTQLRASAVPVSSASLPLPAGASTSALQTTGNTSLASIDTKTPTVGQKTMANSSPVVIASDQSTIPISAASLPLPTGAATDSAINTSNGHLNFIDAATTGYLPYLGTINTNVLGINTKTPAQGQTTMANSSPVVLASDQSAVPVSGTISVSGTVPVSAASLPLPSGAATSALQTTGNTSLANIDNNTGNIASDTSTIAVNSQGRLAITHARIDYSGTPVTTAAYTQVVASLSTGANKISIFDSSGQTLVLAFGAAASEIDQIYIFPGGNGDVDLYVPSTTRISVKAVSATANSGELDINFLS